jgi:hypothetical protein
LGLYDFPVLAVGVEEADEFEVLFDGPLIFAEVGPEVVVVVILELFVAAV